MAKLRALGVRAVEASASSFAIYLKVDREVTPLEKEFLEQLEGGGFWVNADRHVVMVGALTTQDAKHGLDHVLRQGLDVVEAQVTAREEARARLEAEAQEVYDVLGKPDREADSV